MENPIQFAVVREDPLIEKEVVEKFRPTSAMLVASGGCTAFTLNSLFPDLKLTLVDPNPSQLQLIQRKSQALQRVGMDPNVLNIGSEDPQGLNACGNFETLTRCLRDFWRAFVIKPSDLEHMFDSEKRLRSAVETMTSGRFWSVSFDLFFHDELLTELLGPGAVAHAPEGGYPAFFRRAIQKGLTSPDALENPFLHHFMLGHYLTRREAWPLYLQRPPREFQAELLNLDLAQVTNFHPYGLVNLSNSFDWMEENKARDLAQRLDKEMMEGSVVMWRQMQKGRDFTRAFKQFDWQRDLARELLTRERSLFYEELWIGVKQ